MTIKIFLILGLVIVGFYILKWIITLSYFITHKAELVTGFDGVGRYIIDFVNGKTKSLRIIPKYKGMETMLYFKARHKAIKDSENVHAMINVKKVPEELKEALVEVGITSDGQNFKSVNLYFELSREVKPCLKLAGDFFISAIGLDEETQDFLCIIPR